jgi:hypothetical protein
VLYPAELWAPCPGEGPDHTRGTAPVNGVRQPERRPSRASSPAHHGRLANISQSPPDRDFVAGGRLQLRATLTDASSNSYVILNSYPHRRPVARVLLKALRAVDVGPRAAAPYAERARLRFPSQPAPLGSDLLPSRLTSPHLPSLDVSCLRGAGRAHGMAVRQPRPSATLVSCSSACQTHPGCSS